QLSAYKVAHGSYDGASTAPFFTTKIPNSGQENYGLTLAVSVDKQSWTMQASPLNSMLNNGSITLKSDGQKCWTKGTTCTPSATTNWDGR
ncbi:MAG: hypothetical protein WAL54_08705, partial [Acinetobacter bohemicus]